jgi:hypothetical protein
MNEPNFNTDDNNIRFIIESSLAKLEKANVRLWIVVIILIVALIGTNAGWLWWDSQFEDSVTTTQTVTQEATSDGDSDIVIKSVGGDYYGGESEADHNNDNN